MPLTYSIQQVSQILGVSAVTVWRRIQNGEIPEIRVGKRRMVPKAYVDGLFSGAGYPLREESAANA